VWGSEDLLRSAGANELRVDLDEWSRRDSPIHRRSSRAKILALLALLAGIAWSPLQEIWPAVWFGLVLSCAILIARLPLARTILRASAVLPFSAVFSLIAWLAGDAWRAAMLIEKSFLSALAVVIVLGTTPFPNLASGLRQLGAPALLVEVAQFIYRYLFVIADQVRLTRDAAAARGAGGNFQAVTGSAGVLFAHSYQRAEALHNAMLARGYSGRLPVARDSIRLPDVLLVCAAVLLACIPAASSLQIEG
jgi:cobalt/nickel transport system permease protein